MEPSHRISKVPFSHPSQSAGLRKEVLHPFSLSIEKRRFLMPCVGTFISVRRNLHSKFLFRILQLDSGKVVPISFSGDLPDSPFLRLRRDAANGISGILERSEFTSRKIHETYLRVNANRLHGLRVNDA